MWQDDLITFLSNATGAEVTLPAATILAGGASLETWAVTAAWGGVLHDLIVRRDTDSKLYDNALNRADEYRLLQVTHQYGVNIARPLFLNTEDLHPYFVVERHAGISVGAKVVRDPTLAHARTVLPAQLAAQLATIHAVPLRDVDFLPRPTLERTAAQEALQMLRITAARFDTANPTWAFGIRWLERHLPAPTALTLVHGDYRVGNFLVIPDGLSAILDWEFAHLGDPAEDIGWLMVRDWRFGKVQLPIGGISERQPFLEAYQAAGGKPPADARLRWWEIAGNLKWAIFCLAQADRHLSGKEPNIEYATLGRRAAEMEWEVLRLIEG